MVAVDQKEKYKKNKEKYFIFLYLCKEIKRQNQLPPPHKKGRPMKQNHLSAFFIVCQAVTYLKKEFAFILCKPSSAWKKLINRALLD